ncbi:anaerobic ribonucleoside-triphosphate reductase activating protein [uncultured Demequina sp.]|uniref:anaerobic ribonucleoside-triphosphate reductase activating protein n=1 Tax=uncultured Demequina sp. TaxID=693499 RepID=UPI0025DA098C|nr:anaerobic ribonucleoside-triphosphate reductase activating protein [uncultured Demequina sp.]
MHRAPDFRTWRADKVSHGYVADYKPFSFVDGEGVRCSLYVSGCLFACDGCYNEAAWSFRCGTRYDSTLEDALMTDLAHPAVQGLSLLGGEPFLNTQVCLSAAARLRDTFGAERDVWAWSGFLFEQLAEDVRDKRMLLELVDVLVDGPYDAVQRDLTLPHRGSANQRIIDVPASLSAGVAVPWAGGA